MISSSAVAKPTGCTTVYGPTDQWEENRDRRQGSGWATSQSEPRIESRVVNQLRGLNRDEQYPPAKPIVMFL